MTPRTITFSRATSTATHPGGFEGFGGDYAACCADPYFQICRLMTDAGEPDGPAIFVDELGVPCMTVGSFHSCARRYRPNAADRAARAEREAGA
jgi:hypothetical protein